MAHNPDRISLWPGYFDSKVSRRSGRRVPIDSSVRKPDLEGLYAASRSIGLRKVKREEYTSHPKRPHGKEGRLWVSLRGAEEAIGARNKEEILQLVGGQWRKMQVEKLESDKESARKGPAKGDRHARAQRKTSHQRRNPKRKNRKQRRSR